MDIPKLSKVCPICKDSSIVKVSIHSFQSSVNVPQKNIIIYKGWCSNCEIDLFNSKEKGKEWYTTLLKEKYITTTVNKEELVSLSKKYKRYKSLNNRWSCFLDTKKSGDEIMRYEDEGKKYLVIVRNKKIINEFPI